MFQVYKIANKITNEVYIGSSINVKTQWRQHIEASLNKQSPHYKYPLMQAFRKYGVNNFSFEILATVDTFQDMINLEHEYILKEDCVYPKGYNQTCRTDSPMFDSNIAKKMSQTKRQKYGKRVAEIDEDNNIIQIWDSIVEAGEQTKLNRYKISNVCNGTRFTTGGRRFRFIDINNNIIEPIKRINQIKTNRVIKTSRKVAAFNQNDNLVQSFDSVQLAAQFCNGCAATISAVCRNKRKTHKGYKWRYLDE